MLRWEVRAASRDSCGGGVREPGRGLHGAEVNAPALGQKAQLQPLEAGGLGLHTSPLRAPDDSFPKPALPAPRVGITTYFVHLRPHDFMYHKRRKRNAVS